MAWRVVVRSGEASIAVSVVGEPVRGSVILLHGLGESHVAWLGVARFLSERGFRVLVPDLRGHGESTAPKPPSIEDMAGDLASIASSTGVEPVHLVGFSVGGYTILEALARSLVAQPASVVLLGAAHRVGDPQGMLYRARVAREMGVEAVARLIAKLVYPGLPEDKGLSLAKRLFERISVETYSSILESLATRNYSDILAQLSRETPTLVAIGSRDPLVGAEATRELARILGPQGRLEILEGVGHMLHLEAPRRLRAVLEEHLAPWIT